MNTVKGALQGYRAAILWVLYATHAFTGEGGVTQTKT